MPHALISVGLFTDKERQKFKPRCDKRFNLRSSVAIESEVASIICETPTPASLNVTECVSRRLYAALSAKTAGGHTLLQALTEHVFSLEKLEQRLSVDVKEIGNLQAKYKNWPLTDAILDALNQKVTPSNFLTHLHIVQTLAERINAFFKYSEQKDVSKALIISLLESLSPSPLAAKANVLEDYEALLDSRLALPSEAKEIRYRLGDKTKSLTTKVKGIYSDDVGEKISDELCTREHVAGAKAWRVRLNSSSAFIKAALKHQAPLVAGVSNTTARWVTLIDFLGLDEQPKKIYFANVLAFMVYCGHHSTYEVATSINRSLQLLHSYDDNYVILSQDYKTLYGIFIPEAVCSHEVIHLKIEELTDKTTDFATQRPFSA